MVIVRAATTEDAQPAWAVRTIAILHACREHYPQDIIHTWAHGDMPASFAGRLAAEGCIAQVDNRVAGFGVLKLAEQKLDGMFVHPGYMRRGIGRRLVAELEAMASAAGVVELALDASLNGAAFYRACGYAGDEVSVYHSPRGIDLACIPMRKRLPVGAREDS